MGVPLEQGAPPSVQNVIKDYEQKQERPKPTPTQRIEIMSRHIYGATWQIEIQIRNNALGKIQNMSTTQEAPDILAPKSIKPKAEKPPLTERQASSASLAN